MFMKMSGGVNFFMLLYSLCRDMQQEKKTCRFGPSKCLKDMATMFERSRVSGISACIPGQEGTADSTPIEGQEDEDHSEEHREEQITPSSSTGKNLKRK
jgi:hypothetical protein